MAKILSMALIIFVQIYWYKLTKKSEKQWELLWQKIGERFRKTLFELEGLLIKIGQMLSIRADLLPRPFIEQIQDLTDNVPPSDWKEIQQILEKEWGTDIHKYFHSIEESAVASASIGEVYKGILLNGQEVAIKVQRPHIHSIVQTDFRSLAIIIWFANHFVPVPKGFINFNILFQELKQVIERELDYEKELHTLQLFKERFKDSDVLQIPSVYPELCTSNVLIMEWVQGIRVTDKKSLQASNINETDVAKRLLTIFLPQWLEAGTFHADPHPGNVLVSKDGKIILLDFGMIGEISKRDAANFQSLIESFLSKNYRKAVDCLIQLGFLLPEADPRTMEKLLAELLTFQPSQLKEADLIALKLELNHIVQALPIQVPTKYVFLGRSFVTMEGILRQLVPEEELLEIGKPVFLEWLSHQGNQWSFIWRFIQSQPIFKMFDRVFEFLNLPDTLEKQKEVEQRRLFQFTIYENQKKHLFQLLLLSLISSSLAYYVNHLLLLQLAIGFLVIISFSYLRINAKQKKWMKFMHEKRRD